MKKKLFAAFTATMILCSLCACKGQEQPAETDVTTTTIPVETTLAPAYPELLSYEEYLKMTPEQQQAYYETFPDQETYMQWFNEAASAYNETMGEQTPVVGNVGMVTKPTEPNEDPVDPEQTPETPTAKPTTPTKTPTAGAQDKKYPEMLTYEEYLALTPAQQQAYDESFPSNDAYMQWFNQATGEHQNATQATDSTTEQNNPMHLEGTGAAGTGRPS